MNQLVVYKGRTNIVPVGLGFDVSNDTFQSEIRADKNPDSELIATWLVEFKYDGRDGELILTLDNSDTAEITKTTGYMDIKRIVGEEPISVFAQPLQVLFQNVVTA